MIGDVLHRTLSFEQKVEHGTPVGVSDGLKYDRTVSIHRDA